MGVADLDYCELHLKIVNFFSSKPYVDSNTAYTTRDMIYETIEIQEDMYEPKKHALSTARIVFPSLYARPELRALLQNVKEGDRVEIYNFQPDCGDPIFAGYIPPGGIVTNENGHVTLEVPAALGRGQWERLRKIETFNTNTAGYLARTMSAWQDVLNEDFNITFDPNTSKAYTTVGAGQGAVAFQQNNMQMYCLAGGGGTITVQPIFGPTISLAPGNTVLIEALATPIDVQSSAPSTAVNWSLGLINANTDTIGANELLGENTGTSWWDVYGFNINYNGVVTYYPNGYQTPTGFLPNKPGGTQNQYSILLQVQTNGTINAYMYVNFTLVQAVTLPAPRAQSGWTPWVSATLESASATLTSQVNLASWRVRQLKPWLAQAPRFNPQTTSNTYFAANADDYLTAMNNVCELDYSEYRVLYKPAPALDMLELDAVGSLGINASNVLGLQQVTHGVQAGAFAIGIDVGMFTADAASAISPPFRAEEGYNLGKSPVSNRKALNHANLIQRLGSGTLDGQNFYETWSVPETGKPQAVNASINPVPIAPLYPYFESVQNDDRTVLPATIQSLAKNDLLQSTDTTPSLNIVLIEQQQFAFQYRPGDTIRVVTRSLLNNVDTDMRIMSIKHTAGSPAREMTVGKHMNDPSMMALLSMDMQEAWLYSQAGSSPLVIIYPFANQSIAANSFGTDFQFPIDQFTGGTSLVSAKLHWFAGAGAAASNFVACIANQTIDGITSSGVQFTAPNSSGADSGLVDITAVMNSTGNWHMTVKNTTGGALTIAGLFLILKVKIN